MTSEAAVLGTPALKCNTFAGRLAVPNMLEHRFDLCYAYMPESFRSMYDHIEHLLALDPTELRNLWHEKRQRMLDELIDPTNFFADYIENLGVGRGNGM